MSFYGYNPMRDRADPGVLVSNLGKQAERVGSAISTLKKIGDDKKQDELLDLTRQELLEKAQIELMEAGYKPDEAASIASMRFIKRMPKESAEHFLERTTKGWDSVVDVVDKKRAKTVLRDEVKEYQETVGGAPPVAGGERQDLIGKQPGMVELAGAEIIGDQPAQKSNGWEPGTPSQPFDSSNAHLFPSISMPESGSNQAEQPLAYPEQKAEAAMLSPEAQKVIDPQLKVAKEGYEKQQRMTTGPIVSKYIQPARDRSEARNKLWQAGIDPDKFAEDLKAKPTEAQLRMAQAKERYDALGWARQALAEEKNEAMRRESAVRLSKDYAKEAVRAREEAQKAASEARTLRAKYIAKNKENYEQDPETLDEWQLDEIANKETLAKAYKDFAQEYDNLAKTVFPKLSPGEQHNWDEGANPYDYRSGGSQGGGDQPIGVPGSAPAPQRQTVSQPSLSVQPANNLPTSSQEDAEALRWIQDPANRSHPSYQGVVQKLKAKGLI